MAKRTGFKVSILTPWTLLPENLPVDQCADEQADKFADVLCSRIRTKLLRFSFWPRARGEAYIHSSFDAFQERFLQYSEYAVIVLSGHHVSCLDSIYPRLLVFFTMRPSWSARFLLVFLGEPKGHFRFDTSVLKHDAITFNGSSEDHWSSDEESWSKLFRILKADYRSPSLEDFRNIKPQRWMSVRDLRGHHLAVKVVRTPNPSDTKPYSWNDLRYCNNDNPKKQLGDCGQQNFGLNSASSQSKPELTSERSRNDSESSNQYDIEHRSASLPHLPLRCISVPGGTARSSTSPTLNSDLSPYVGLQAKPSFDEDSRQIKENEEEITRESSEEDFEIRAGVMSPIIEENSELTSVESVDTMAPQVEQNLTPSSLTGYQPKMLASRNIVPVLDGYAPFKNPPVSTAVESKRGILRGDADSTTPTVKEHSKILIVSAAGKDKPHPSVYLESAHVPSRPQTEISSDSVIKQITVRPSGTSDFVLNAAPQMPPQSLMTLEFYPTKLIDEIPHLQTNQNINDPASAYTLAEQSKPYENPVTDWELRNGTNAKPPKEHRLDSEAGNSLVQSRFNPEDKKHEVKKLSTSMDLAYSNPAEVGTGNMNPAVDTMSELENRSNSTLSFTSIDLSEHEPALNHVPLSSFEHVQVQTAVPEGSMEHFNSDTMMEYANDGIIEPVSVSRDKQSDIPRVYHKEEVKSFRLDQHQKETQLPKIFCDHGYSESSEDVQSMKREFGVTALQSEVQELTGRYLVECEETDQSESGCLERIILVSNPVPKLYAKPPATDPLGEIFVESHGNNLGEERQTPNGEDWTSMIVDNRIKGILSDKSLVVDLHGYREFIENERTSSSTVLRNFVETGGDSCLLKMSPDSQIQLESSGERLKGKCNQITSASSFLGTENLDQQGQQEIVVFDQTFGQHRPQIWSLTCLISMAEFLAGYIPRHLRWFYSSVFQSREEMMDEMAGRNLTMRVHDGLRNPVYVTLVFFGIATASPHISQWPQLVANLFGSYDLYLYAPTIFANRPILSYLGRAWPWGGSTRLT
ncbi:hypothetical protein T265_09886 [Opisthorchis viverrini]|uniref:Uncharacterized protein n=1 Tax=Opisthorchis viverrini TaxID=6198 RepID=A0A074Z8J9_OPIVI|nr:hypothetical protein T265_09886 [Opisthorchis viverrini]KER21907.1 hypothetical protein T265_09886 [Opisthorchis viverrini]